ncbi:MAG: hypothetical protein ACP5GZ_12045, partial [Vulcanisaeta sp.]
PRSVNKLLRLYKHGLSSARLINCPVPRREAYEAWLSIVDGLIDAVGIDELLRYALKLLIGIEEDKEASDRESRDPIHELLQALNLT